MIPRTCPQHTDLTEERGQHINWQQQQGWQEQLRQAITKPEELLQILQLPRSRWPVGIDQPALQFSLKVPRGFVARMQAGDPDDPLLRQVLPLAAEMQAVDGFHKDPVGDQAATCEPGLIQKYHGRALMITTGACAIHCRYCFRRHFPYSQSHTGGNKLDATLSTIRADSSISEVILSGGDPLMLDDEALANVLKEINQIPHIRRIRIHSRLPVVLPARITKSLIQTLVALDQEIILVIHANHPNEIDQSVADALTQLRQVGIRLYNQSVLLKGVNDDSYTLASLSEALFQQHVQPYYLHQLDRVAGAAHFEVSEHHARAIMQKLQAYLPGYLTPKYVREMAGESSKTLINI